MTHINDEINGSTANASGHGQNEQGETAHPMAEDVKQNQEETKAEGTAPNLKALEAELAKWQADAAEWQDKYMRLAAESENIRRRQEKERADLLKYGNEGLIKDLLPILDGFDKALANGQNTPEMEPFLNGFAMLQKQLVDVLDKRGLTAVPSAGAPFDPNLHQAIQRLESADVVVDTVHQEFAKGYVLNERLVRPAMVSVLVPSGKNEG